MPNTRKVLQLKNKGLSIKDISNLSGISPHSVSTILKENSSLIDIDIEDFKKNQADSFATLGKMLVEKQIIALRSMDDEAIRSLPLKQKSLFIRDMSTPLGIYTDKQRLLSGESTANISQLTTIIEKATKQSRGDIKSRDSD